MTRTRTALALILLLVGAGPAAADFLAPTAVGSYRADLARGELVYRGTDPAPIVGNTSTLRTYHGHAAYLAFDLAAGVSVRGLSLAGRGAFPDWGSWSWLDFRDVTTPLADLRLDRPDRDAGGLAAFDDLSSGRGYGSAHIGVVGDLGTGFDVRLNAAAVADAEAARLAGRPFIIGVAAGGGPAWVELADLRLTVVPEPGSLVLLALGGAVLAAGRRRARGGHRASSGGRASATWAMTTA